MSSCSNDCSSCSSNCSSRREPQDLHFKLHEKSSVKKVIGIVSGKGGVGKSMTTSLMAVGMNRAGYKVGVLDADVTGPSIPKGFGLHEQLFGTSEGLIVPAMTNRGIDVVSINLLLDTETTPVIWRGPVLGNVIKQFWSETLWKDIDYMFVDNAAMRMIQEPTFFDVMVTENTFGDILTDEASCISGSMGLLPSASIGLHTSVYEPIHGSWPQAAGKNIANPLATILSAAMMFEYSFGLKAEGALIRKAVDVSMEEGIRTPDIQIEGAKAYSTSEVGDWIASYIRKA